MTHFDRQVSTLFLSSYDLHLLSQDPSLSFFYFAFIFVNVRASTFPICSRNTVFYLVPEGYLINPQYIYIFSKSKHHSTSQKV